MNPWQKMILDRRQPVCPQMILHLKRQLAAGLLQNGQRLPSRRETAAALEINLNTVQKTYRELETEGLIVTDGNQGSLVCCPPETLSRIQQELTRGMAEEFVRSAKELHLNFKQAIDILSELWEEVP